jgi:hypothetical protein
MNIRILVFGFALLVLLRSTSCVRNKTISITNKTASPIVLSSMCIKCAKDTVWYVACNDTIIKKNATYKAYFPADSVISVIQENVKCNKFDGSIVYYKQNTMVIGKLSYWYLGRNQNYNIEE